jgi:hypothetical protein
MNSDDEKDEEHQVIKINCSLNELNQQKQINNLKMIEMQGKLETRPMRDQNINGIQLGNLYHNDKDSKCSLIVERQKCDGNKMKLKKPILLCKKNVNIETGEVWYSISGIVREKYHFKTRPIPLSPSPTKNKKQDFSTTLNNNNETISKKLSFSSPNSSQPNNENDNDDKNMKFNNNSSSLSFLTNNSNNNNCNTTTTTTTTNNNNNNNNNKKSRKVKDQDDNHPMKKLFFPTLNKRKKK